VKGLDSNVLVRYLTRDDAEQADRALAAIERAEAANERLAVSVIVLVELAWVLRRAYGVARTELADSVEALLQTPVFAIEDRDVVRRALRSYREGRGDFADHLLGARYHDGGVTAVLTFDRALHGQAGFTAP